VAWRGGVRAPSLLRPLDPLPFPSSSSSPSHSSLFLFSRSAQVVYAPAKVVFRVTMLKAMSYICKANARSFARVSASTRSRAPSCVRACVRADVRAREYRTGSVRERAMTWSRSWQKLSAFRRKARLLDRDKTRPWGVARYRVRVADDLVEFRFVWFEDRVGRGPNCHRASENGSIWNFRAHASLHRRERFLGRVEPLNVKKRFVLNRQFKFGKFPR